MEDDLRITLYYLARGLLRITESLASQTTKESDAGAADATAGH